MKAMIRVVPAHRGQASGSTSYTCLIRAQARFAIGASAIRMSHLINGRRPVTADLALRPARFFDQTPLSWLNLQSRYG